MEILYAALLIVGGIECFFGYRIFRILTAIMGFVVGAAIGGLLGAAASGTTAAIVFGLLLGILGAYLAYILYKLGVFIICFAAGAALGAALGLASGDTSTAITFAAVIGLILGVLGVILTKPLIIISSGAGGGMMAGIGLGLMMSDLRIGVVLGIVLAVAGIIVQFQQDKKAPSNAPGSASGAAADTSAGTAAGTAVGTTAATGLDTVKAGIAGLGQKMTAGAQNAAKGTHRQLYGWNELVWQEQPLWYKGTPIVVNEASLVTPSAGGGVCLSLGFQNLERKGIRGVFFSVKCYDLLKQQLEGIEKLSLQDFQVAPGQLWYTEQPIPLPDKDTRRVELAVTNVVFDDGAIWNGDKDAAVVPLAAQDVLDLPPELAGELFQECRTLISGDPARLFRFQPRKEDDHWWCACGQMNLDDTCLACGIQAEALFDLVQPQRLTEIREARLAEQERQEQEWREMMAERERQREIAEQERRQKIAEQTAAAKQKVAEVSAKTTETLIKGLDKGVGAAAAAVAALKKKTAAASEPKAEVPQSPTPAEQKPTSDASPKFCSRCGTPLEPGINFCPGCGKSIKE